MKKIVLVLLAVAIAVSAVGCAAKPQAKFKIAIVPPALVSPYFITLADAAKEYGAKNPDLEVVVLAASAETAIEEQTKILEDLILKKVNMIAVATTNWEALSPTLQKAREQKIEVVCIDRVIPLEGVDTLSLLGVDEVKGGELVGEFVTEVLGGKGKVAVLEGVTGDYWSVRRTQGFHNIVDNSPEIDVAATQPANWERAMGMSTMENILQAQEGLDIVWGLNDNMALGALQAVEAAGLQDQIQVIGYNADQEAKEAVRDGRMLATVAQQPAIIAQTIVEDIAVKVMDGKRGEVPPVIPIPLTLVTKDNVADFLK